MRRQDRLQTSDTRRFAYPHRMMMVLSDGKHFRVGAKRQRRVALSFLDDATRYGLGILVGTAESTLLFLRGLYEVIVRFGLMNSLYLDHGPGSISDDTRTVVARLKRHLVHGRVRYPEGHGKVERYHRTLKHKVLRSLDGRPEVDPDCGALTLRLSRWLREDYNHTPHESLDGMTPSERWLADDRDLTLPADGSWLDEQFLVTGSGGGARDLGHGRGLGHGRYATTQRSEPTTGDSSSPTKTSCGRPRKTTPRSEQGSRVWCWRLLPAAVRSGGALQCAAPTVPLDT